MDHGYFKDRLSAFIDRELPDYERQAVHEHLEECDECRKIIAHLQQVDSLVEKHSGLDATDYWEKAARQIENRIGVEDEAETVTEMPRSGWSGLRWKITAAAASVAILIFIGLHQMDILDEANQDSTKVQRATPPPSLQADSALHRNKPEPQLEVRDTEPESAGRQQKAEDQDVERRGSAQEEPAMQKAPAMLKESMESAGDAQPGTVAYKKPGLLTRDDSQRVSLQADAMKGAIESHQSVSVERFRDTFYASPEALPSTDMAEADSVSHPQLTLEDWLEQKDSLEAVWAVELQDREKLNVGKSVRSKSLSSVVTVERQLLENYYNIARLTKDTDQELYDTMVESLQEYLDRPDAVHMSVAQDYLNRLQNEQ